MFKISANFWPGNDSLKDNLVTALRIPLIVKGELLESNPTAIANNPLRTFESVHRSVRGLRIDVDSNHEYIDLIRTISRYRTVSFYICQRYPDHAFYEVNSLNRVYATLTGTILTLVLLNTNNFRVSVSTIGGLMFLLRFPNGVELEVDDTIRTVYNGINNRVLGFTYTAEDTAHLVGTLREYGVA